MYMKFPFVGILIILATTVIILLPSCKKNLEDTDAFAIVEKINLNYGNNRIYNGFTIKNTGQKALHFQVDEQTDWLEVYNPIGEVAGRDEIEITCKVTRAGFEQKNYFGKIFINTNGGDYTIDVYMMVDMYIVTFINPVFTNIIIDIDTLENLNTQTLYSRKIGKNDSVQYGFFTPPDFVSYYAQTSGRYTDSTQLGLMMEWNGSASLINQEIPRFFLDISKTYFHLSIINNFQVLNPLYINPGTQFEVLENIFIYQSSDPLPIGYYHALGNTSIRAHVAGSNSYVTWQNGSQFTFPDSINQFAIVDNYSSDTIGSKSTTPSNFYQTLSSQSCREFGDVFEIIAKEK